jgi:hypothetical protein
MLLMNEMNDIESAHSRHRDIGQNDIRFCGPDKSDKLLAVTGFPHHLDVLNRLEQRFDTGAN